MGRILLHGRARVARVGASIFASLCLNGDIPQGTQLGPELFAVMVNDFVQSWVARIKFVDDLTSRFWRLHVAILHPFLM